MVDKGSARPLTTHLDKVQVLLVEEELHGLVGPLVDGGGCGRRDVVAGTPVRSADGRLGYVEGVLGPRPRRRRRGVVEVEQATGLLTIGAGGGGGGSSSSSGGGSADGGGGGGAGGRRTSDVLCAISVDHRLVEIGLEQADRALLGGLHRTGLRHLDRRRVTEVRGGASARRRRRRSRRRTQGGDAWRLRRQGWLAGYWRPPVAAETDGATLQDGRDFEKMGRKSGWFDPIRTADRAEPRCPRTKTSLAGLSRGWKMVNRPDETYWRTKTLHSAARLSCTDVRRIIGYPIASQF